MYTSPAISKDEFATTNPATPASEDDGTGPRSGCLLNSTGRWPSPETVAMREMGLVALN
jgi:hypothetical protein